MTPELELVLCCLRSRPDGGDSAVEPLRSGLKAKLEWQQVIAQAQEHRVEPFVYDFLKSLSDDSVPAPCIEALQQSVRKTSGLSMLLFSELLRIQSVFEQNQIPLVPYKGPILSWLAYRDLTRRRSLDLDFFVPQACVVRATALLQSLDFEARFEHGEGADSLPRQIPGQYSFTRTAPRTQIELHTERTLRHYPVPLDFAKMSRRLITIEPGGARLRTFSVEDTLVMLCVHGAKHFWERLIWLQDIACLAAQQVDWNATLRIAEALRCSRLLLLGLYLAHDLLDAPIPDDLVKGAANDANVQWLAERVRKGLLGERSLVVGMLPRAAFRYRSRDSVGQGIWHTLRLGTMPTEAGPRRMRHL